jgi:hypothetical protein
VGGKPQLPTGPGQRAPPVANGEGLWHPQVQDLKVCRNLGIAGRLQRAECLLGSSHHQAQGDGIRREPGRIGVTAVQREGDWHDKRGVRVKPLLNVAGDSGGQASLDEHRLDAPRSDRCLILKFSEHRLLLGNQDKPDHRSITDTARTVRWAL